MHNPEYIGDGVYASRDDFNSLVLTTGHHDPAQADNTIILEPQVLDALLRYVGRMKEAK